MTSFHPSDDPREDLSDNQRPSLGRLSAQLNSLNVRDRVLAMIELQKETMPAQDAYPLVQQALRDEAVQVRGMAVFSLGIKPTPDSLSQLIQILESDSDYNVRAMAAGALGYLADKQAFDALRHVFFEDTSWLVRFSAAVALGNLKDLQATTVLMEALESDQTLLQEAAVTALGEIGAIDQVERILDFASSDDWMMRKRVAEALGNLPCSKSRSALRYFSTDAHPQVAEAASRSLQRLETRSDIASLSRSLITE